MEYAKTAISIKKDLLHQADELAQTMHTNRSKLIALALEEFLQKAENRRLLDQINAAYADESDQAEAQTLRASRKTHRAVLKGEPWR